MNQVNLKPMNFSVPSKAYNTLLGAVSTGKKYKATEAELNKMGIAINKKQFEAITILHNR